MANMADRMYYNVYQKMNVEGVKNINGWCYFHFLLECPPTVPSAGGKKKPLLLAALDNSKY